MNSVGEKKKLVVKKDDKLEKKAFRKFGINNNMNDKYGS